MRRLCSPSRATIPPHSPRARGPTSSAAPAEPSSAFPANSGSRKIEIAVEHDYWPQLQIRSEGALADGLAAELLERRLVGVVARHREVVAHHLLLLPLLGHALDRVGERRVRQHVAVD